jgi:chromosome segregation ATPase
MTGEEMERAIEFLLDQQVKFDGDMQKLSEAQATTTTQIQSLAEAQEKRAQSLETSIQSLAEVQEKRAQSLETSIQSLAEAQEKVNGSMRVLTETVVDLAESVSRLETRMDETKQTVQSIIEEMRDGFNKLILANEATRDLAEKAAQLAINTSQRVTNIENKLQ